MKQHEILEYNMRCAELLTISEEIENELVAYPEQQYSPLCSYANAAYITDKEDNPDNTVWNYCKFHSDWNWIMEVVEAIEKLEVWDKEYDSEYSVNILNKCCLIDSLDYKTPVEYSCAETKKEAVVQSINQFLIWYEQNK